MDSELIVRAGKDHHAHFLVPRPRAFNLRMPDSIKVRLAECAKENGRSLNAEIVQRLRASLEGYQR